MNELTKEAQADLHRQLVKLGDMIGDGLHLEPGGKWISQEYKRVMTALGITPPRRRRPVPPERKQAINDQMAKRCEQVACQACDGKLKQTQPGSMRAVCTECGQKYQLLRRGRAK